MRRFFLLILILIICLFIFSSCYSYSNEYFKLKEDYELLQYEYEEMVFKYEDSIEAIYAQFTKDCDPFYSLIDYFEDESISFDEAYAAFDELHTNLRKYNN